MAKKIHLEPSQFQKYMDAMTKWQRTVILFSLKLTDLGEGDYAKTVLKMDKQELERELLEHMKVHRKDEEKHRVLFQP